MRQIRQTLQLHYQAGLTYAELGRALGVPKSTIGKMVSMARAAGVDWATAQALSDDELEARLYRPPVPRADGRLEPEFALIHQELKRPGVTLMLLWEEYQRGHAAAGLPAYKYTSFCVKYREWAARLKRSMRQTHVAGERLFVPRPRPGPPPASLGARADVHAGARDPRVRPNFELGTREMQTCAKLCDLLSCGDKFFLAPCHLLRPCVIPSRRSCNSPAIASSPSAWSEPMRCSPRVLRKIVRSPKPA